MHILKAQQFDKDTLQSIFNKARLLEDPVLGPTLGRRIMASVFYEPSTRTRFSFEAAMLQLGGSVISTENAEQFSSAAKGEILEDTIRVISEYSDLIVLRHHAEGAAIRAAKVSSVPIINAGDGAGQHPTQAIIDLYTINKEFHSPDKLTFAFMGDVAHSRTIHSLVYLLSKYDVEHIYFVSPEFISPKPELIRYLQVKHISCSPCRHIEDIIDHVDVWYQTRLQKERLGDGGSFDMDVAFQAVAHEYRIDNNIAEQMKTDAIIMHPLPRRGELALDVDTNPRARYFEQAANGVAVRQALILKALEL